MKGNRKNHAFSAYMSPVALGIYMLEKPSNSKEIESRTIVYPTSGGYLYTG